VHEIAKQKGLELNIVFISLTKFMFVRGSVFSELRTVSMDNVKFYHINAEEMLDSIGISQKSKYFLLAVRAEDII